MAEVFKSRMSIKRAKGDRPDSLLAAFSKICYVEESTPDIFLNTNRILAEEQFGYLLKVS
jgi:hypothetical protein